MFELNLDDANAEVGKRFQRLFPLRTIWLGLLTVAILVSSTVNVLFYLRYQVTEEKVEGMRRSLRSIEIDMSSIRSDVSLTSVDMNSIDSKLSSIESDIDSIQNRGANSTGNR